MARRERVFTTKSSAAGSGLTSVDITVPNNSGEGYKIEVAFASNTIADVDGVVFTISIDGVSICDNEPAIVQSALWGIGHDVGYRARFLEGSKINITVNNDQATAIVFYTRLFMQNDQR